MGLPGKKGADLVDGSDVKAVNTWEAIDTPRFNGVLKAGTKSASAGKLLSLDVVPYLFFVLWDHRSRTIPAAEFGVCAPNTILYSDPCATCGFSSVTGAKLLATIFNSTRRED